MYRNNKRKLHTDVERINISDYMRGFVCELSQKENSPVKITRPFEAERIKGLMNISANTTFKSIADFRSGIPFWDEQKVDFVPSNLGKGFIFYFLCNNCGKRVKNLYFPSMVEEPLCMRCCRLQYKQPRRKQRVLSELLGRNYLSTEHKYMAMKKLGITRDDIENYLSDYSGP